ncbi:MAG: SpoIIE family protein phosphatase [Ignavibacteriales bacterium]|nr:SpoIIE family protein phosphatase [Ignavibacteriales bacterium]
MKQVNTIEIERLNNLIQASKVLNSTLDLKELLSIILGLALDSCKAERGSIYLVDEIKKELWSEVLNGKGVREIRLPLGKGIAGTVALTGETKNIMDVQKDKLFYDGIDQISGFATKSMLCMPLKNNQNKIIGVFQLLNSRNERFTFADEDFLNALSSHASIALENVKLHEEILKKQKIENELQVAAEIQRKLLPKADPQIPDYDISGINIPSKLIGGDYYDYIEDNDGNLICVVADVSGKGIAAALLVSTIQAWLHALVETNLEIKDIVNKLNEVIYKETSTNIFITCFLGKIFIKEKVFNYVNAGHNPGFHFSKDGSLYLMEKGGIPLGMFSFANYEQESIHFNPGDTIVLYTDGIPEAQNGVEEFYGDDRFIKNIRANLNEKTGDILKNLFGEVRKFVNSTQQDDDWTISIIKKK